MSCQAAAVPICLTERERQTAHERTTADRFPSSTLFSSQNNLNNRSRIGSLRQVSRRMWWVRVVPLPCLHNISPSTILTQQQVWLVRNSPINSAIIDWFTGTELQQRFPI